MANPHATPIVIPSLHLFLLLLLLPSVVVIFASAYIGPTHCVRPPRTVWNAASGGVGGGGGGPVGYSTYNHLLFDLASLFADYDDGAMIPEDRLVFRLCPGSIIDLDDGTLPLGFLPIRVPGTTLQCGEYGYGSDDRDGEDACVIRGGGKRLGYISSSSSTHDRWNDRPERSYKPNEEGILGGGEGCVAQVYVYGDTAYGVTLRGITFDNAVSDDEMRLYGEYVSAFGGGGGIAGSDVDAAGDVDEAGGGPPSTTLGSTSTSTTMTTPPPKRHRRVQGDGPRPAYRFASVAMRGKGYGDDAGPRLITIEDCSFVNHRGYAIIVSPGIQMPIMPMAPEFRYTNRTAETDEGGDVGTEDASTMPSSNPRGSRQLYADHGNRMVVVGGDDANRRGRRRRDRGTSDPPRRRRRKLNLLDDGNMYIPPDGLVSYYDHGDSGKYNYLDGRRVKISRTVFSDNESYEDGSVAGLVTSAYSITVTDCLFERNTGKSMVFVYNDDAMVDDTVFVENTVDVSTIIMSSPKEESETTSTTTASDAASIVSEYIEPTHIVERSCFLGSKVGISNVLATSSETVGFGQRDNHVSGTAFTWASTCDGAAAEEFGDDCLMMGNCDGTCVEFTSPECSASRVKSGGNDQRSNGDGGGFGGYFDGVLGALLGAVLFVVWETCWWNL
ncbi:hypothetical protein ACHAXA_008614 [Cyclostephanos tholiformis]|uniref:Uncharacterized protein n=1 Tax=Cyclostephanos tholiformis TaxID=382380 RepID=A0ABD3SPV6_9STRA